MDYLVNYLRASRQHALLWLERSCSRNDAARESVHELERFHDQPMRLNSRLEIVADDGARLQ